MRACKLPTMDITYSSDPLAERDALRQRYYLPSPDDDAASRKKTQDSDSPVQYLALAATTEREDGKPFGTITSTAAPDTIVIDSASSLLTMPSADPISITPTSIATCDAAAPVKEVKVSSSPPSRAALDKAADLTVYDADGRGVPFKNLYWAEPDQRRRVMVIFIRHFFCGNCQEYIRTLVAHIPPTSLPDDTSIAIVGCGSHTLIPSYIELTSCPYPIYADPTRRLFTVLGMQCSLSLGHKDPNYIQHTLAAGMVKSIVQGVRRIGAGDVTKAGDMRQNGGEFVLEVKGGEEKLSTVLKAKGNPGLRKLEVVFCYRMQNTRDHTEIPILSQVLGMPGADDRSRKRSPRMERRCTSGGGLGNLARSLSNRRQSWLERRHSSSWSRARRQDRSDSATRETGSRRRSPDRVIETVREDVKSRDGESREGPVGQSSLVASPNGQEDSTAGERFSFEGGQAAAA